MIYDVDVHLCFFYVHPYLYPIGKMMSCCDVGGK